MSVVLSAIKARMGSTEYFVATMTTRELIRSAQPAYLFHWWEKLTLDERMQREVNEARITKELAPYFATDPDRFCGSVIVAVYDGQVEFESLNSLKIDAPKAYSHLVPNIGFITISKGDLVMLDGQHRWMGLSKVIKKEVKGKVAADVPEDEITVIFINSENNYPKTRKIFNKVNRYAKPTSKSDNLITSEDDGVAILCRLLMNTDGSPLNIVDEEDNNLLVNWKSNTLTARSQKLTTLSALYETTKTMLNASDSPNKTIAAKHQQLRPDDYEIQIAYEFVESIWRKIFTELDAFKLVSQDVSRIVELREASASPHALLLKPAGQIAFIESLFYAKEKSGLPLEKLLKKANMIDWSLENDIWTNIIVNPKKTINANKEARDRTVKLITYLLIGDTMSKQEIKAIQKIYSEAKEGADTLIPLPEIATRKGSEKKSKLSFV